eukprot:1821026-Rhodomonas_salina.2
MKSARKGVWLAMAMRQTSTPSVKILGMATESCVGSAASRRASERATRKSFPKEWAIQRSSPDLLRQRLASETCRNFEHQQVESVFVHQQAGIANIAGGVHAQRQRFLILNKNSRNQSLWTLNSRGSMRKNIRPGPLSCPAAAHSQTAQSAAPGVRLPSSYVGVYCVLIADIAGGAVSCILREPAGSTLEKQTGAARSVAVWGGKLRYSLRNARY